MAIVIKGRKVVTDNWLLLECAADGTPPAVPPAGDVIVPLPLWQAQRGQLLARPARLGLRLEPHDDPAAIDADLGLFGVIAVNFPTFSDGRGYSIARLLRERYRYHGELRAIGEAVRDHLFFMASCGFDAFQLRDDQDPEVALTAFTDFSEAYQTSVARPQPLFRRRVLAARDGIDLS